MPPRIFKARLTGPSPRASLTALALGAACALADPFTSALAQPAAPTMPATLPASQTQAEELLLQIELNGILQGEEARLVLRDSSGTFLLSEQDMRALRIKLPAVPALTVDGMSYYKISDIPGATATLQQETQRVLLTFAPDAFDAVRLQGNKTSIQPTATRPSLGGFLDYDVLAQHSTGNNSVAGTFNVGIFSPLGVMTTGLLGHTGDDPNPSVRLDSTWTYDRPDQLASLRIGDSISRAASGWGSSVRFGGIQYGTNFATQPGLVLLPQQSVSGTAVVPSAVDVFINNSLVSHQNVPAGPFSIGNIPILAGPGMIQVVTRDVLGREQLTQMPFFGSSYLLKQGLDDYSFETGKERLNYGLASNDYADSFGSATWRHGFNSWFTGEIHAEASTHNDRALGIGSAVLLGDVGLVNATFASSTGDRGTGELYGLGFVRQGTWASLSLNAQYTTPDFWQLGLDPTARAPKLLTTSSFGVNMGHAGSVNLTYVYQDYRSATQPTVKLGTVGWTFLVAHSAFVGITANRSFAADHDKSIGLFFNVPLGHLTNASSSVQRSQDSSGTHWSGTAAVQRSLPVGEGWGYRLQVQDPSNVQGSGSYQNNYGTYTAQVATQSGSTAERLEAQGSLLTLGGQVFASRTTSDSFALVRVPGFADVRVYNGNQLVGLTDASGTAIVPRLLAYQRNYLSIDEQDLPLDAKLSTLSQVAVPWYRSGIVVDFPVSRTLSAEMHVVDAAGQSISAGATAFLEPSGEAYVVADGGRLYLNGLKARNRVRIERDGQAPCFIEFPFAAGNDPLPDLGEMTCTGASP